MIIEGDSFKKLKSLLKSIFRVDYEDLDFGIYKIMNYKSREVNSFIDSLNQINDNSIKSNSSEIELFYNDVYNNVYTFFSRYFDNGDLIPQLRFGGKTKYYIPYNGEEVSLYWANSNEYYVKTTEHFYKYVFTASDPLNNYSKWKVIFEIKNAELEQNYVKSEEDKYFVLDSAPILVNNSDRELTIFFNYRKLIEDDLGTYNLNIDDRNIQTKLKTEMIDIIINKLSTQNEADLVYILQLKDSEKTILEKHLNIYIKKNNSDYFIHKNLKEFLLNELEFYLKEEVLDLSDLVDSKKKIDAIKILSNQIIEFLVQIENFEKKLWEKKKYIYNVNYVITLDRIEDKNGIELIKRLIDNPGIQEQINEWKEYGIIDNDFKKSDIIKNNLTTEVNPTYKFLPIDIKYFKELKWEILSLFNNLDDELDGTLIHSENFQALNMLIPKFKDSVQTIYIDPPFNKESNANYLYNVKYKDSTWATMLENRISLAKKLL